MKFKLILALVSGALLSACDNTDNITNSIPGGAVITTVASDF